MDLVLSKDQSQGQVKSNKATKTKCCMIVMQHMFFGSFGTQNSMVTFISKFDQRKDQFQVKEGQIRSNVQIQNFLTETCLSCPVLSQNSNKYYLFLRTTIKIQKIAFKKVTSNLPVFCHCTARNKDVALKLGMCVVCMWLYNIFPVYVSKILDF